MKVTHHESKFPLVSADIKHHRNMSALCAKNGSSSVSARKMRRIAKSLERKNNNKSYTITNA